MSKDFDERLYDVDQYGCIRPGATFWLSACVLTRFWIFLAFMLVSGQWTVGMDELFAGAVPTVAWVGELPAVVLVLVAARRVPEAGRLLRGLWHKGPYLIFMTVVAHGVWLAQFYLANETDSPRMLAIMIAFVILDAGVLVSAFMSPFFRTLFKEFPQAK